MVNSESEVLPATSAIPTEGVVNEEQGGELLASRLSRDDGWLDSDHYFEQDLPSDSFKDGEWKERYKDLDEIQVNGAIRRQWKKGKL